MELDLLKKIGLALALGMLVGTEREFSQRREGEPLFAGSRTFALLALLGAISGYLASHTSPLILPGALLVVGALITMSYFLSIRSGGQLGTTTEISALLTFLIGVIVAIGELLVASITTIAVVTILALKPSFRVFTGKISHEDIYATLKFAIITVVILPFLPNRIIGPLGVFNPAETWWIVILVSGISFAGYVLIKFVGARRSVPVVGLLGGLASSTAVAVSFAQRRKQNAELSRVLALGVVIALTAARLARESLEASTAAATIILAARSNTLMKGGIALMFGARLFGRQVAMALGMILLAGMVGLALVWV